MALREIARRDWRRYCDSMSKQVAGKRAELDVVALDLGDRAEARWVPFIGIVYEPRADALEVGLEGLGHSISEPREIHVEETDRGVVSLEIVTARGVVEILRFREPVPLAPLESAAGVPEVES